MDNNLGDRLYESALGDEFCAGVRIDRGGDTTLSEYLMVAAHGPDVMSEHLQYLEGLGGKVCDESDDESFTAGDEGLNLSLEYRGPSVVEVIDKRTGNEVLMFGENFNYRVASVMNGLTELDVVSVPPEAEMKAFVSGSVGEESLSRLPALTDLIIFYRSLLEIVVLNSGVDARCSERAQERRSGRKVQPFLRDVRYARRRLKVAA